MAELAAQISADSGAEVSALVTVLRGAWVFAADLSRQLSVEHTMDFVGVASYDGTESSGAVRITKPVEDDIGGRRVLVVEDIVDTGRTLAAVLKLLGASEPASLRVVSLLDKPARRVAPVRLDYVGFEIPNVFVVGYGLDLDGHYRRLPYLAAVDDPRIPTERATGRRS